MSDSPNRDRSGTSAFDRYAAWYDAFNQGKDYAAEALYVLDLVRTWKPSVKTWLDVGCGTGNHLAVLQSQGLSVEGIDISRSMIARARAAHTNIVFHFARAQDFKLSHNPDVISLLFHAMSYQTSDAMLVGALHNASTHLSPNGVLVFDFWHTDGVLQDPPTTRVRETRIDGRPLFRVSHPVEDRRRRLIEVRFEFRWDAADGPLVHSEAHAMRHFTGAELRRLLTNEGLEVVACRAWLQHRPLLDKDWYGVICAIKKADGL